MSARVVRNPDLPEGAQYPRQFTFTQPGGLNQEVIGQDSVTKENIIQINIPNSILKITVDLPVATQTVKYKFFVRRQEQNVHTIYDDQIKYDLQYVDPLFPLNLSPGSYQLIMVQTLGTAAARNLTVLLQVPLT